MNYIIIKTTYILGIPYHAYSWYDSYSDAKSVFDEMRNEASNVSDSKSEKSTEPDFIESFSSGDDDKGNCEFYAMLSEDSVIKSIMNAVDNSDNTITFKHIGSMPYEMYCKTISFNSGEEFYFNRDEEHEFKSFYLDKIIKRPYDIDNPQDPDSIYDVYLKCKTSDGEITSYCDSLECICYSAVIATFCEIFIK